MRSIRSRLHARVVSALLVCALAALPQAEAGASTVRYASPTGVLSGYCTTWGTACKLQRALSVAVSGDQIWAKQGSYLPTTGTDRTKSFHLKTGVAVYGGFAGTETSLAQRNWRTHITALSGDIGLAYPVLTDDSYHVVNGSSVSATAVLDGFSILYGQADGASPNDWGAGIYISAGSPTLRNLVIEYNTAGAGGGMSIYNGSPNLSRVTFYANQAANGGAIFNYSYLSHPVLSNVAVRGNSATGNGGGIYIDSAAATIRGATFSFNTAANGAALYGTDFGVTPVTNATFYHNTASSYGGAMYITESQPVLKNLTFTANSAGVTGGAIYNTTSSASPSIYNSIFWGDGATEVVNAVVSPVITLKNSVVAGGCPLSGVTCTHVFAGDPVLGPIGSYGGATQTIRLEAGSSAIDAGDPATCPTADQRGVHRPQGPVCDAGSYEVRAKKFASQAAYDGWVTESGQATYVGGTAVSTGTTFRVGDTATRKQLRGFVSFDTSGLPDSAAVVKAVLKTKRGSVVGSLGSLGTMHADVANSYFGTGPALVASDFQAISAQSPAATVSPPSTTSWWTGVVYTTALIYMNKTGITQFRLYFDTTTDGDSIADYLSLYSGETATAADRPTLTVYYNP